MGVIEQRPTIRERIRAAFGVVVDSTTNYPSKPNDPLPLTLSVQASRPKWAGYDKTVARRELAERIKFDNLSRFNGPAAVCLDAYNHSIWTNGWRIESENEDLADKVTERIQNMHAENVLKMLTMDGLKYGYGIGEKAPTKLSPKIVLVARCARQFDLVQDKKGILQAVRQYDLEGKAIMDLPIGKATVLMPMITSDGMGKSILEQCYDPLTWFPMMGESCMDAIARHGNPIWNIQLGTPGGGVVPQDVMNGMEGLTTDLNSKAEIVTSVQTQIKELNQAGVPNIDKYLTFVLQCISASSGVPEELFGLGGGRTGLLAASKWAIFYDKINSIQHTLEPQFDDQIVDAICIEEGGAVGDCHWLFVNPNSQNDTDKAAYCKAIHDINPLNPIVPNDWYLDYLGIKLSAKDLKDMNVPAVPAHNPFQPKQTEIPKNPLKEGMSPGKSR